jgi:protocatechuate 3,4-dioxygenase beta subunit
VSPNPHPTSTVTRRQAVGMAGAAGAAVLLSKVSGPDRLLESIGISDTAQAAATACVLTPSKTEGPYFVDEKLNRSDIRTDPTDGTAQAGIPLSLTMAVVRADGDCAPVAGAAVDIWHANAAGKYSDISSEGTSGKRYLRGVQVTDAAGQATFTTIYPGWYAGRAVHVHFKVRLFDGTSKTYEFTSQLFFDPTTTNSVYATSAYSSRGTPNTPNSADNIYGSDGSKLVVALTPDGNGGYAGTFVVGLSGLPGATGTGTGNGATAGTVSAAVGSTRFRRTSSNRRILRVASTVGETVTITARLSRSGTTIAKKTQGAVAAGARTLELRIPRATAGGSARLTMTYADASGAKKTVRRAVTIPVRRRG